MKIGKLNYEVFYWRPGHNQYSPVQTQALEDTGPEPHEATLIKCKYFYVSFLENAFLLIT